MVSKIERINLIRGLFIKLSNLDPLLATVVMKEHGWQHQGFLEWNEAENGYLITNFLMESTDSNLNEMNSYFLSSGEPSSTIPEVNVGFADQVRFKLFLSHKSEHKVIAVELKNQLALEGIEAFVAHQDIQDNAPWREALKSELSSSHAFVVLLTEGTDQSVWCQQEIGWAMAKQIPTIAVNFIPNPPSFGFLSDYQYIQYGAGNLKEVAQRISNSLLDNPVTRNAMRIQKCELLVKSWSYDRTRLVWTSILSLGQLSFQEIEIIRKAFDNNLQVRDCSIDRKDPGVAILDFIENQSRALTH